MLKQGFANTIIVIFAGSQHLLISNYEYFKVST